MKILAHVFLDGELLTRRTLGFVPRTGETIRLHDDVFGKITEVIWCFDEEVSGSQRINLRLERIAD